MAIAVESSIIMHTSIFPPDDPNAVQHDGVWHTFTWEGPEEGRVTINKDSLLLAEVARQVHWENEGLLRVGPFRLQIVEEDLDKLYFRRVEMEGQKQESSSDITVATRPPAEQRAVKRLSIVEVKELSLEDEDGVQYGYALIQDDPLVDKGVFIRAIAVHAEYRGQGWGRALLETIIKRWGDGPIWLRVGPYNESPLSWDETREWYYRYGFVEEWEERDGADHFMRRPAGKTHISPREIQRV